MRATGDRRRGKQIACPSCWNGSRRHRVHDCLFAIASATDRAIGINELAYSCLRPKLTAVRALVPRVKHNLRQATLRLPKGATIAEVRIDPDTGVTEVVSTNDVKHFGGSLINPLLVEGQLHAAACRASGRRSWERTVYDEDGQLLNRSYMDYALPRSPELFLISPS